MEASGQAPRQATRSFGWYVAKLVALAMLAGFGWLTLIACGLGLFVGIVPAYVMVLRATLLRARVGRPRVPVTGPFLVVLAGVVASVVGLAACVQFVGGALPEASDLTRRLWMLAGAGGVGAATAPLLWVPLAMMDPETPAAPRSALLMATSTVSSAPLRALVFALVHAGLFVSPLVIAAAPGWSARDAFLVVTAAGMLTTPALAFFVARFYLAHRPDVLADAPLGESTRGARISLVLLGFAGVLLLGVVARMVLMPLPLQLERPGSTSLDPASTQPLPARLPGTDIMLRARPDGLSIDAADGGGAGLVSLPDGMVATGVLVSPRERASLRAGREARIVVLGNWSAVSVCLDARGVRCDDSWQDRLSRRFWLGAFVPLCFALLFLTLVSWRHLSDWAARSQLRDLRDDGESKGMRALAGRLRLGGTDARVELGSKRGRHATHAVVVGDVRLDGGDLVVRLPPGRVRAIARSPYELGEGAGVTIVGAFPRLVAGGFRDGEVELPKGYWLVEGDVREAAIELAASAARQAIVSLTLASLGLLAAAVTLLVFTGS